MFYIVFVTLDTYQEQTNIEDPVSQTTDENEEEGDGDGDEENDNNNTNTVSCRDPIACYSSSVSYCSNQKCDGTQDCPFADDEKDCESFTEEGVNFFCLFSFF